MRHLPKNNRGWKIRADRGQGSWDEHFHGPKINIWFSLEGKHPLEARYHPGLCWKLGRITEQQSREGSGNDTKLSSSSHSRAGKTDGGDLQSGLFLLFFSGQGVALSRQQVSHVRRGAGEFRQLVKAHRNPQVTVAWQRGEPTLMGIDFYRRAIELQEKYRKPGMKFENTIQTNGTLLDDEWCQFFKENNFLIERVLKFNLISQLG